MKRERTVVLWLMFLPGLLSVAGWGLSPLLGIAPPNYGFFIVMALLTVPWTGVCAAFLTGTWPELRGTGFRRAGIGLLIWVAATGLNALLVGNVLVAGCVRLYNRNR